MKQNIKKLNMLKLQNKTNKKIHLFNIVKSTNDLATNYTFNDIIIAKGQLKGKGTHERSFISPFKKGIYMSYNERINEELLNEGYLSYITLIVAIIVSDAINKYLTNETKIKWINDIYLNNKKICGILVEKKDFLIIGIGINLYHYLFNIKNASSIEDETKIVVPINELITDIINGLDEAFKTLTKESIAKYLKCYKAKCLTIGKNIKFNNDDNIYKVLDLNESFHLIVEANGKIKEIKTAEQYQIIGE